MLVRAHRVYSRTGCSLLEAIDCASEARDVAGEYAKMSLRRLLLELNLDAWESHPLRTRDDVRRVFRKAINKLGHRPGGWLVAR